MRDAARTYGVVVGNLVRVKNRLNAVYRSRGIALEGQEIYEKKRRKEYLAQLPEGRRALADVLTQEMDSLEAL